MRTGHQQKGKGWLIAGALSLVLLALVWSVDQSIVYFLLGIATFSFFQYFRLSSGGLLKATYRSAGKTNPRKLNPTIEHVIKNLENGFRNTSFSHAATGCIQAAGGFFTLFIVLVVIALIFSDIEEDFASYYFKGNEFYSNGQYDSAAYYYRLAAREDPEFPAVYYDWGNAFAGLNRYDSAIKVYDLALALDPQYSDARYSKGYALYQLTRYQEAIHEARLILKYEPENLNAMLLSGDSFYTEQHLDSALYYYTRAYSTGYRSSVLSHLIAYIHDTKGQTDQAIKHYKEAIALDNSLGEIYARLGELLTGEEGNFYRTKAAEMNL